MNDRAVTIARVLHLLDYDPCTGLFKWKNKTSNRIKVGAVAGADNGNGYIRIAIDGYRCYAHRLAWAVMNGHFPPFEVDHIDGNPSNNSIINLRAATHPQNAQNQRFRKTNTSGRSGVSWSKQHKKWEAYIMVNGRKAHLGLFNCVDAAGKAYLDAKLESHEFQPVPRELICA